MRVCFLFILLIFFTTTLTAQQVKVDTSAFARPKLFELAFLNDSTFEVPNSNNRFYVTNFGNIKIQTGKIVLSSYERIGQTLAFTQNFPKGTFSIDLAISIDDNYSSLAFGRIIFSSNPVVRWEYALRPNEQKKSFIDPVTSNNCQWENSEYAMLVFGDSASHQYFHKTQKFLKIKNILEKFNDFGNSELKVHRFSSGNFSLIALKADWQPCYRTYIGYDKSGKICRLLFDTGALTFSSSLF